MTKEDQIQLVEDPGPITPVDFEKLFHEKSYQIRIDSARHLLQLPDEPFCVIKDPERFALRYKNFSTAYLVESKEGLFVPLSFPANQWSPLSIYNKWLAGNET